MLVTLRLKELRLEERVDGTLKLWVKRVVDKILPITAENTARGEGAKDFCFRFKNLGEYKKELSSSDDFQFELDCSSFCLKSEKFNGKDLIRLAH